MVNKKLFVLGPIVNNKYIIWAENKMKQNHELKFYLFRFRNDLDTTSPDEIENLLSSMDCFQLNKESDYHIANEIDHAIEIYYQGKKYILANNWLEKIIKD